jgi:hypothetical protein
MLTYERALIGLIEDDPNDDLRFHHLVDEPGERAERKTALVVAINYSVLLDRVRGFVMPPYDDWDLIRQQTADIERWQEQIIERWQALDRLDELTAMPYREYLRTPEWQARRVRALEAALHRCSVCNTSSNLDVHHRTYERRGAEVETDLTVLCRSCHGLFHEHRDLIR